MPPYALPRKILAMFFSWDIISYTLPCFLLYSMPLGTKNTVFLIQAPSMHVTLFTVTNTIFNDLHDKLHCLGPLIDSSVAVTT